MVTLKDIKISKTRIPLQNALWLRPIGGLTFKLYYPHGSDWAEASISNSGGGKEDDSIAKLEQRIVKVEENIVKLSNNLVNSINSIGVSLARTNSNISNINLKISDIKTSIDRLYESVDFTTITLTKTLILDAEEQPMMLNEYGIDSYYEDAIERGTAKRAIIPGYDDPFSVTSSGVGSIVGFNRVRWADFSLLRGSKYTLFTIVASPVHPVGKPAYFTYSYTGFSLDITDSVFVLDNTIKEETKEGTTLEYLEQYGITLETIQSMAQKENATVLFKDEPTPYEAIASYQEGNETSFNVELYSYDFVTNTTKCFYLYGALLGGNWGVDVIFERVEGNIQEG